MEKACSIMVSKVKSQSMAGRGDFSKMWFFFSRYIDIFFSCFYAGGKMLIFLDVIFFGFARVCFKKQQKKRSDILRLMPLRSGNVVARRPTLRFWSRSKPSNPWVMTQWNILIASKKENDFRRKKWSESSHAFPRAFKRCRKCR